MPDAISVRGVSKLYRLGLREPQFDSLGQAVGAFLRSPVRNYRRYRSMYDFRDVRDEGTGRDDVVWALRDVSFSVAEGEVLGIIGSNGAGKSTMLKVLARITPPTRGEAVIRGRISSLLEVGTGFHPELTGRENVYLNGTVLGMRKREVDARFDEIVAFAGIERFLDMPVKRYSSGMTVRLAFAVAAHLEPEILIIDEVLAVGDAAFQRRCMDKMQSVGRDGRTVLFVSHNMQAIGTLCQRAILLKGGRLIDDGPAAGVVGQYLRPGEGLMAARRWDAHHAPGGEVARLVAVRLTDREGRVVETVDVTEPLAVEIEYDVLRDGYTLLPHFHVYNDEGVRLFIALDQDPAWRDQARPAGRYVSRGWVPGNLLSDGLLFISPALVTLNPNMPQFYARDAVGVQVVDSGRPDSARGDYTRPLGGVIRPRLEWETRLLNAQEVV